MANNRLHIYCTTCLEICTIAKYYPCEWYVHKWDSNLEHELDSFLKKHSSDCHKGLNGEGMFGLRTENDNDEFITDYGQHPHKLIRKEPCPSIPTPLS